MNEVRTDSAGLEELMGFFNAQHDKLLCTASVTGEPDAALMGTPKLEVDGRITFTISEAASISLRNIQTNKQVLFVAYRQGDRARDYAGVRIAAQVDEVSFNGPSFLAAQQRISERHGSVKAATLQALVTCSIKGVRAIVDRGQHWRETL